MRDLPGQALMPFMGANVVGEDGAAAVEALRGSLPSKPTMTPAEAAVCLGVSRRQVEYWMTEGTLLALYAGRDPNPERRHARPVVRLDRAFDPKRVKFLTVEELRVRNSNVMQG